MSLLLSSHSCPHRPNITQRTRWVRWGGGWRRGGGKRGGKASFCCPWKIPEKSGASQNERHGSLAESLDFRFEPWSKDRSGDGLPPLRGIAAYEES